MIVSWWCANRSRWWRVWHQWGQWGPEMTPDGAREFAIPPREVKAKVSEPDAAWYQHRTCRACKRAEMRRVT